MASCSNSAFAYRTTRQSSQSTESCPPICVNIVDLGAGNQNVVQGLTQQCGTITNVTNILKTNPFLAVLTFILVMVLFIVMSSNTDSADSEDSGPSLPGMPGIEF